MEDIKSRIVTKYLTYFKADKINYPGGKEVNFYSLILLLSSQSLSIRIDTVHFILKESN